MFANKFLSSMFLVESIVRNPNSQPVRNKKIEKTHVKENNHMYKTIFTWFDNLPTSMKL